MHYRGFPKKLVSTLCCSICGRALTSSTEEEYIDEEVVACVCGKEYRIHEGILEYHELTELPVLLQSEAEERDRQATRYDRRLDVRFFREVQSTLRAMGDLQNAVVLEYGAGTGRLTSAYAAEVSAVVACDFSRNSLEILKHKLQKNSVIGLVIADCTKLQTTSDTFTHALAAQVFEHFPYDATRHAFLRSCMQSLRMGGVFISSTYHYDLRMRLKKEKREGLHSGGIYFRYYEQHELRSLFEVVGVVELLHPIDIVLPFETRFVSSEKIRGYISRSLERVPLLNQFGHLLLARLKKTHDIVPVS